MKKLSITLKGLTMKKRKKAASKKAVKKRKKIVAKKVVKKRRKVTAKKAVKKPVGNTRFPGLPGYTGPAVGWFAFMHHGKLAEYSTNINERIDYIKRRKPAKEIPVRLQHIMYLGEGLGDKITKACKADSYNNYPPYQESKAPYEMHPAILAYVRRHKPDHTWGNGTLHFTNEPGSPALYGWNLSPKKDWPQIKSGYIHKVAPVELLNSPGPI